ncbi:MAG: MBL fold metallo-hydrolase [Proteobacteria bacterium]|nr:MBL fold metallo-hydrolase [Pseudomonadota bacterium]
MPSAETFYVRFWGVRGSIACPGPNTVRYGGNTSCLEVRCGERTLIFDAGTGLRNLGAELLAQSPLDIDLFLTHTHFDHVCGLPFFAPLFIPENKIRLAAGNLQPDYSLKQVLVDMMMAPLFPVPPEVFRANVTYRDFVAGETQEPSAGIKIHTGPLNHPNNATGYRIEFAGKVISYITDTEHREDGLDPTVLGLIKDADIFIYDCTYTDEEYPRFKGFGHSTWQEGVRLAQAANVKTLAIFHHEPSHNDEIMDQIATDAESARPGTVVAREGMTLVP